MIGTPIGGEDLGPNILRAAQHRGYELTGLVVWRAGLNLRRWTTLLRGLSTTGEDLCATDEDAWIDTERPPDQAENDDHADAETAAAAGYAQAATARRARLAVILDVGTLAQIIPAHICLPSEFQPSRWQRFAVANLSIQSRRLAGTFSEFTHFGIVPKTKNVCEPRISGGDGAAEKKKNNI
jgi:hypothetical protein